MQMTTPFKLGLAALVALALACVVLLLVADDGVGRREGEGYGDGTGADGRGAARGGETLGAGRPPRGGTGGRSPSLQPSGTAPGPHGVVPGLRTPSGLDLSDPTVRASELGRLLGGAEIDWREVAKILAVMQEPVPQELRGALLHELRMGRRNQVMHAFAALNDPSFTDDLFDILDDPESARGARAAALQALWRMPGADADRVALRLEARLTQDFGQDREVLYAIAARGGTEATRAMVQYIQSIKTPSAVPPYILQTLNAHDDPESAAVVTDALREARDPGVLSALISMASRPGASAYTRALIDLDRPGQDDGVRTRALTALGAIGDEQAVDYLLERGQQADAFGERALQAIGRIRSADPGARGKLRKALEDADKNPRPEKAREQLLLAVGALRDEPALPVVVKHLDDPAVGVLNAAVRAMGRMREASRPYVDRLVAKFDKGDQGTRMHVAVALGSIGGKAAIEALQRMMQDEELSPSLQRTLRMSYRAARDDEERASGSGR